MKAPRTQIAQVIAARSLKRRLTPADKRSIAAYILEEGRTGELDSLLRDVQAGWAEAGYVQVTATSAHELPRAARQHIEAEAKRMYPHAKRIHIVSQLDPTVIGGVQLELSGYRLDLTVAGELKKFKLLAENGKD